MGRWVHWVIERAAWPGMLKRWFEPHAMKHPFLLTGMIILAGLFAEGTRCEQAGKNDHSRQQEWVFHRVRLKPALQHSGPSCAFDHPMYPSPHPRILPRLSLLF